MINLRYLLKKTFQLIISLLILTFIVFMISRLSPGDPLRSYFGDAVERMSPHQLNVARKNLGLDDNIILQYFKWLNNSARGDFGISYKYKQAVLAVIGKVYLNTLYLTVSSFLLIFIFAFFLAIICATHEGTFLDRSISKLGVASSSVPVFFVSLILIMFFSIKLKILPTSGAYDYSGGGGFIDRLRHLILPVLSIVITHLWYCTYIIKSKLSDEIRKEYILLCRVKGLSQTRIIFYHSMKNVLPSVVSIMAVFLPHIIGGSYIVEMVFSYPGLGTLGFESALYHDYNMLMVICLITGFVVISGSMIAQSINEKLDPRMKYEENNRGNDFE